MLTKFYYKESEETDNGVNGATDGTPGTTTTVSEGTGILNKGIDQAKLNAGLNLGVVGMNAVDSAVSHALDFKQDAGDGIAQAASSIAGAFPPPYGQIAQIGIQGLNTLTKIGGHKIAGFDGNTGSSAMADFSTADKQFRGMFGKGAGVRKAEAEAARAASAFASAKSVVEEQNLQNEARQATLQEELMETQQELSGGADYDSILLREGGQILNALEYDLNTIFDYYTPSMKDGGVIEEQYNLDTIFDYYNPIEKFQKGGNLLPSGALHKNKHNMQVDILDGQITKKGIPVVSIEEGGEVIQHAEIEAAEIIFELSVTKKLEKYWQDGSEEAMIKAGELLVEEILNNTDDNVDLIKQIKNENKNKEQNVQSIGGGDTYGVV